MVKDGEEEEEEEEEEVGWRINNEFAPSSWLGCVSGGRYLEAAWKSARIILAAALLRNGFWEFLGDFLSLFVERESCFVGGKGD